MAKKNIAFVDVDWLEAGMKSLGDSIRAKSGAEGGLSFPDEMKAAVDSITGGTGDEEINDILDEINGEIVGETQYTVTFIGVNGEQLGQMSVYEGDDCADPVATGVFETPTKEGDKYYGWSFNGWSLTDGGGASSAALADVRSNRIVYAAFTSYEIFIAQGELKEFVGKSVNWTLNPDYVLRIFGSGLIVFDTTPTAEDYTSVVPWYPHHENISAVIIDSDSTIISAYAFCDCTALVSVNIPAQVANIGVNAFRNCISLSSATFADPEGWYVGAESNTISVETLSNAATAATALREKTNTWEKSNDGV